VRTIRPPVKMPPHLARVLYQCSGSLAVDLSCPLLTDKESHISSHGSRPDKSCEERHKEGYRRDEVGKGVTMECDDANGNRRSENLEPSPAPRVKHVLVLGGVPRPHCRISPVVLCRPVVGRSAIRRGPWRLRHNNEARPELH
jgi:hypothetical protein